MIAAAGSLSVRSSNSARKESINSRLQDTYWDSLDIVRHKNADGEDRFYSSKPPLMATIIAGEYWILHKLTGWTLGDHPFELGRIMLVTFNLLPLLVGWMCLPRSSRIGERVIGGASALVATVCFATMMSAFSAALTNHLWAFVTGILATYDASRIWRGSKNPLYFVGRAFGHVSVYLRIACGEFCRGVVLLVGVCRYAADNFFCSPRGPAGCRDVLWHELHRARNLEAAVLVWRGRCQCRRGDQERTQQLVQLRVHSRDRRRETGYWKDPKSMNPVDLVEPSKWYYAFNGLLGHHGNFSLTPNFAAVFPGEVLMIRARSWDMRLYGLLVVGVVSFVCIFICGDWISDSAIRRPDQRVSTIALAPSALAVGRDAGF